MITMEVVAAAIFGVALVHTFSTKFFERLAHRRPAHAGIWHLLGEVEVVFGFWAMVMLVLMALQQEGTDTTTVFFGATALTAVTGGGLTVIANAPNPAGIAIPRGGLENDAIHPLGLLIAALPATLTTVLAFRML